VPQCLRGQLEDLVILRYYRSILSMGMIIPLANKPADPRRARSSRVESARLDRL
jgi:hypothetical protein